MKHTEGPFGITWKDGSAVISVDDGHGKIATVHLRKTYTQSGEELKGNAILLAAAPDLADALEWIGRDECAGPEDGMPICREGLPGKQMPKDLWCFRCWARAALSKAGK